MDLLQWFHPSLYIYLPSPVDKQIRIGDIDVRHGVLQLNPSNTVFLGGEVASMNQHPRRLVIMNQMKRRLG